MTKTFYCRRSLQFSERSKNIFWSFYSYEPFFNQILILKKEIKNPINFHIRLDFVIAAATRKYSSDVSLTPNTLKVMWLYFSQSGFIYFSQGSFLLEENSTFQFSFFKTKIPFFHQGAIYYFISSLFLLLLTLHFATSSKYLFSLNLNFVIFCCLHNLFSFGNLPFRFLLFYKRKIDFFERRTGQHQHSFFSMTCFAFSK